MINVIDRMLRGLAVFPRRKCFTACVKIDDFILEHLGEVRQTLVYA